MRVQLEDSGLAVELAGPPLGSGGEAAIYAVPELPNRAAKVYHRPTVEHAEKLAAMLAAPPADPGAGSGHFSIAWPVKRLLSTVEVGRVVGYLMPRVHNVRLIQEFYNPKARLQACPLFHYGYLLRTARNLAISVRALHERGYVVGDLSAANLLVSTQALVTLVDTDSFQVPAGERIFRCHVGTPEYTPPELQGARFADVDRGPEHDAFGLAVLIFQLLMQGNHPFAGLYTGSGEPPAIPRRILAGHWPYAQRQLVPFQPSPHAPPWQVLPPPVQELMRRCFEDGHEKPAVRPTAHQWQRALQDAEQTVVPCPANSQHVYHRGLERCPWCALAAQQGRDPFPSAAAVQASGGAPPPERPSSTMLPVQKVEPQPPAVPKAPREKRPRVRVEERFLGSRLLGVLALLGCGALLLAVVLVWSWAAGISSPPPEPGPFPPWLPEVAQFPHQAFAGVLPAELLARLDGHTGAVRTAVFSADGRYILSGSDDKMVRLWEVDSGRTVTTLTGHGAEITSVALSADGRYALSGSRDRTARYWELDSGKQLLSFDHHGDWVTGVSFLPDGLSALSAGNDKLIRRWNLTTGREWHPFEGHRGWVECFAVSRDGQWLASGDNEKELRLWNVASGQGIDRYKFAERELACLTFAPDSQRLLLGGFDNTLRLWKRAPLGQVRTLPGHSDAVLSAAFSPDGRLAVSGSRDRTIRVWDLAAGRELHQIAPAYGVVYAVAFSPDGATLLSAHENQHIYLWRLPESNKDRLTDPLLEDETPVGTEDSDLLHGSWTVQLDERDGKAAPPLYYRQLRLDFEGDRVTARTRDSTVVRSGRYHLDSLARPKTLEIELLDAPAPAPVARGLYRLDGDRLKIVVNYTGREPPPSFDASGPGVERLVLKKVRP